MLYIDEADPEFTYFLEKKKNYFRFDPRIKGKTVHKINYNIEGSFGFRNRYGEVCVQAVFLIRPNVHVEIRRVELEGFARYINEDEIKRQIKTAVYELNRIRVNDGLFTELCDPTNIDQQNDVRSTICEFMRANLNSFGFDLDWTRTRFSLG
ncbi:MAG: hypothetical protein UR93_C0009G0022 [Berkelbacteria bacterium GW2011_GWA2_35_9]|uniref:Uncharacterized protein n=1 Tax=Berkelbacteria bacterium GW2011_GWA2_35_9 TaxID=1618333 RepID=A0A0G0D3I4_9BACT|nr:MAG: hypothetical protein UR93_C0009G0022 [Berkelbacteria bacterium GW2011_GWA2_35_9]